VVKEETQKHLMN